MPISRRRFIRICGTTAAVTVLPFGRSRPVSAVTWSGVALGAVASMRIEGVEPVQARALVARVVDEVHRLEAIFSLYRPDSALCELNRRGVLAAPPAELVHLLAQCDLYWRLTGGTFDPTVQPLWNAYAAHFSKTPAGGPPTAAVIEAALERVGWRHVRVDRDLVVLTHKGMAITLNGIAQGYITDRIVALLADAGIAHALVDMGEIRAIGTRTDRTSWSVALDAGPASTNRLIALHNRAVATTAASGFFFDATGTCNHLFDPASGSCALPSRTVSVVAPSATAADALSTALDLMEPSAAARLAETLADIQVHRTEPAA